MKRPTRKSAALERAFGQVLRDARIKAKLTQEGLAHEAGLDTSFVSMLERGKRQPSLSTLFALAKVLKIAPSRLVAQTGVKAFGSELPG